MEAALARLPGVTADEARLAAHSRALVFDDKYSAALVDDRRRPLRLRLRRRPRGSPHRTRPARTRSLVQPRRTARRRSSATTTCSSSTSTTGRESALTTDGAAKILNGKLDWVYEEEIYGRGQNRALLVEPRLLAHRVSAHRRHARFPRYITVDDIPYDPTVETLGLSEGRRSESDRQARRRARRPAAAPHVDRHVEVPGGRSPDRSASGGRPTAGRSSTRCRTARRRGSTSTSADLAAGATHTILRETSKAWVSSDDDDEPIWLKDGSFLWLSERTGCEAPLSLQGRRHARQAGHRRQVGGAHAARRRRSERAGSTSPAPSDSPIGVDVYRIKLDGSGPAATLEGRRHAHGDVQPGARLLHRHLERRDDADRRCGCTRTTAARCA